MLKFLKDKLPYISFTIIINLATVIYKQYVALVEMQKHIFVLQHDVYELKEKVSFLTEEIIMNKPSSGTIVEVQPTTYTFYDMFREIIEPGPWDAYLLPYFFLLASFAIESKKELAFLSLLISFHTFGIDALYDIYKKYYQTPKVDRIPSEKVEVSPEPFVEEQLPIEDDGVLILVFNCIQSSA